MSGPDIKIEGDAFQALVMKSIVDTLGTEEKEAIIIQALQGVLEKKEDSRDWSSNPKTVLDAALEQGLRTVVHRSVIEYLESNEALMAKIREALNPQVQAAVENYSLEEMFSEALVEVITKAAKERRYS